MYLRTSKGNTPRNQHIEYRKNGVLFVSYGSYIAFKHHNGKIFLDSYYWDYSATTGKYRNQFLGENIAETRKNINNGIYKLCDLKTIVK